MKKTIFLGSVISLTLLTLLSSCASNKELPVALKDGELSAVVDVKASEDLFKEAKAKFDQKKFSKAAGKFRKYYRKYPFGKHAAEAIYLRGRCLEDARKILLAFDEYQKIATRYRLSGFYAKAIDRQVAIATGAYDQRLKEHFLFLSATISESQTVILLNQIIENAPNSLVAVKAQEKIASIYAKQKDPTDAVRAYEKLVLEYPRSAQAPRAQYEIGKLLIRDAEEGRNKDSANINRAKQAFKDLVTLYPNDSNVPAAKDAIKKLEKQELSTSFDIAKFYFRKKEYQSSKVYFQRILSSPAASSKAKAEAKKYLAKLEKIKG